MSKLLLDECCKTLNQLKGLKKTGMEIKEYYNLTKIIPEISDLLEKRNKLKSELNKVFNKLHTFEKKDIFFRVIR